MVIIMKNCLKHNIKELICINEDLLYCPLCKRAMTRGEWHEYENSNSQVVLREFVDEIDGDIYESESFPFIIAHEYMRLKLLIEESSVFGVLLQLKDLFEATLKYYVLINLSYFASREHEENSNYFRELLKKPLSLGDWLQIARKISSDPVAIEKDVLKYLVYIYDKEKLVNWRNKEIGHGALKNRCDETFLTDIHSKLVLARKMLYEVKARNESQYLIAINTENQEEYDLNGTNFTQNIETNKLKGWLLSFTNNTSEWFEENNFRYNDYTLSISTKEGRFDLDPFIFLAEKGIYFFDVFIPRRIKLNNLSYISGHKKAIRKNGANKLYLRKICWSKCRLL